VICLPLAARVISSTLNFKAGAANLSDFAFLVSQQFSVIDLPVVSARSRKKLIGVSFPAIRPGHGERRPGGVVAISREE
jgi:hypothetical protein